MQIEKPDTFMGIRLFISSLTNCCGRSLNWEAADQQARLEELASLEGTLPEVPLRRDVRSLGLLLGR